MRELFDRTERGDNLTAEHVQKLSNVARSTAAGAPGSYMAGQQYSVMMSAAYPPFVQVIVKVEEPEEDATEGVYPVRIRYYDQGSDSWSTDFNAGPYVLDAREVGGTYTKDDIVVAWWHQQRQAFIPMSSGGNILRVGKASETLSPGAFGKVKIWEEGVETDTELEEVWHDWITNGTAISANTEVIIGWFSLESRWRVIGAECP